MRAGQLRHRIKIERDAGTDSNGYHVEDWQTLVDRLPAERMQTGGGETIRGGIQVQASTTHVYRIRYRTDVTSKMRVIDDGNTINITAVRDHWGTMRETIIEGEAAS